MEIKNYITKRDHIGLYFQRFIVLIGLILTFYSIYQYYTQQIYFGMIPLVMLVFIYFTIISLTLVEFEKVKSYYKIGLIH